MLSPADISRLHPDQYELLWRSILRREHGDRYRRIDGYGIDCMGDGIAYQIYSHQGGRWQGVQLKFREDLAAAQSARKEGKIEFDHWIFISTFPFKEPAHAKWLEQQRAEALPVIVECWGEEALFETGARQTAAERMVGLAMHAPPHRPLVGVPCTFDDRSFFLAWDGDFDHLDVKPPREVTGAELVAIHCAICSYESEPQQPIWQRVDGPSRREVWEIDGERTYRRKLRSAHLKHEISFLTVGRRPDLRCKPFCERCGRTTDGNYCSTCSTQMRPSVRLRRCI